MLTELIGIGRRIMCELGDEYFSLFTTGTRDECDVRAFRNILSHSCAVIDGLIIGMGVNK
jgi:hypothetical protein